MHRKLKSEDRSTLQESESTITNRDQIAEGISVEELYLIRTRSNEYILIVDARSRKEYEEEHISGAIPLVYPVSHIYFRTNSNRTISVDSPKFECFSTLITMTEARKWQTTMPLKASKPST